MLLRDTRGSRPQIIRGNTWPLETSGRSQNTRQSSRNVTADRVWRRKLPPTVRCESLAVCAVGETQITYDLYLARYCVMCTMREMF